MKTKLTLEGQLKKLADRVDDLETEETIPEIGGGMWVKEVYVLTEDFGVFYSGDFVTDERYPDGVPTWATVNTGLTLVGEDGLGLRGDPWEPEHRQYCLMTDGLYRRVAGGNWVCVLTFAAALAMSGADDGPALSCFGDNGLDTSINQQNHVGVLFTGWDSVLGAKACYIVSADYGATWTCYSISGWMATGAFAHSLTIGAYQGSSTYMPGQAIYCGGRRGIGTVLWYSTDGGATWGFTSLGAAVWEPHILVDPNDQSRVFVGCRDGAGPWNVYVSTDHGATIAQYDANASEDLGYANPWYHLSVGMDDARTVRVGAQSGRAHLHMTRDDGITWDEPVTEFSTTSLAISIVQDAPDKLYLMRRANGVAADNWHTIWASENEGRNMVPKSGANCAVGGTGGGDSLPWNHGGIVGILQLWVSATRHPLDSAEHIGDVAYPQLDSLVGTGAGTIAAGSHAAQHETGGPDALAHLNAVVIDTGNLGIARMPTGGIWNLTSQLVIDEAGGAAVKFLDGIEGPNAAALDINRIIAQNVDLWAGLGAGNPLLRIYGWQAAVGLRYGRFGIANADGAFFIQAERSLLLEALATTATLRTAAGSDLYLDAGGEFQWRDRDAADAIRMLLDSATGQLRLPVQGIGAGLLLGGDALLYRLAANQLGTPDSARIGGSLGVWDGAAEGLGLGIAAANVLQSRGSNANIGLRLAAKGSGDLWLNWDGGTGGVKVANGAGVERVRFEADGSVYMFDLPSGATQAAAGAGVDELWHDTDDHTIKIGV